jgi:hypothetical protein
MFQMGLLTMLMASVALIALPVYAQSEEGGRQDVAVQACGSFVTTTTQNGIDNSASNRGGVLASYRFFGMHHGVEANDGYALNTQGYNSATGSIGVRSYSHEVSGAYAFRLSLRSLNPFALADVGALVFDPGDFSGASTQTRAAFVYEADADIDLSHHLFMRAEYRGFVYNSRPMIFRHSVVWTASPIGRILPLDSVIAFHGRT